MSDNKDVDIQNFLDDKGKIKVWPSKKYKKKAVVEYLSTKFEVRIEYSEKEVNQIIDEWHTFNDYFLLRRSLIDMKYMKRTKNGSHYWLNI